jgi:hypothetical protein
VLFFRFYNNSKKAVFSPSVLDIGLVVIGNQYFIYVSENETFKLPWLQSCLQAQSQDIAQIVEIALPHHSCPKHTKQKRNHEVQVQILTSTVLCSIWTNKIDNA